MTATAAHVLARVGTIEITSDDVARHETFRRATLGVQSRTDLVDELIERALWTLAGQDAHLELPGAWAAQELVRDRLLLAGFAAPERRDRSNRRGPGSPHPAPSIRPTRPGDPVLAAEASADAYVHFVQDQLVYRQVELSPDEIRAADPVDVVRLRHARGAAALAAALTRLRARWSVQRFE